MTSEKIIIDASECSLGRLASYAAKEALKGNDVIIFNAEKALISGGRDEIFARRKKQYGAKSQVNPWRYGPKRPKNPDRFLRRVIRGMLPWTTTRGKNAFKKVMVYMGKPENEIRKKHNMEISKAKLADTSSLKRHYDLFVTVGELCKFLGGKDGSD
ncbi:MAG: 50S ribosomal protein L13 [Candidatus Altiarchaeota archaeon]|nr:50S ribosomal protein L13 [Candidatus Altiarchaeota archaeon]